MRPLILTLAATSLLLAITPDGSNRLHRTLPTRTLSIVRGADTGNATAQVSYCDNQNLGSGQAGWNSGCNALQGVNSQTVCVWCRGDSGVNRVSGPGANGPNFAPWNYYNCSGDKIMGTCTMTDPVRLPGQYFCVLQAWDGTSTCTGSLYETYDQTTQPPGGDN